MNTHTHFGGTGRLAAVGLALLAAFGSLTPLRARAAEPLFVGVLALVEDRSVAEELGLSDVQTQKLLDLIVGRESDALELALKLKGLSPGERAEKLAPFRAESEQKGLLLLTPQQRVKLEHIRVRRLGLASLAEPPIAAKLKLTEGQQKQVADLLRQREDRLAEVGRDKAYVVRSEIERKLAAVLTSEQSSAWDAMTAEAAAKTAVSVTPASVPSESKPAEPAAPPAVAGETKPPEPAEKTASGGPAAFPDDVTKKHSPSAQAATKPGVTEPGQTTEAAKPAAAEGENVPKKEPKLRFSFRYQPWEDVLKWFAEQADLSLELPEVPKGTFNYTDDRDYTPAEALDVLNSVLLTKGYTLIRRQRMLMMVNLENGIPPNLIDTIPVDELDKRGNYELVTVPFELEKLTPEELEPEIRKMIGPQGAVVAQPKARQILVTETAGRLRAIRRMIQRSEDPEGRDSHEIRTFEIKYADPTQAVAILRQFLDIPPEQSTTQDGSIKIVMDPSGKKFLATGSPEKLARVAEVLKTVDVEGSAPVKPSLEDTPQLEVYSVAPADPQSVLQVVTTMMANTPDVRLATDPKTGNLIAMARLKDQATIRAVVEQIRTDPRKIEVIQLSTVDPQAAALAIGQLFGGSGDNADPNKPQVNADPTSKQLIVRATTAQIEQIRSLLEKMGEEGGGGEPVPRRHMRTLPLTGRAAQNVLEQAQQIWPTMHRNPIRVVTPSAGIPTIRPGSSDEGASGGAGRDEPMDFLRDLMGPSPGGMTPGVGGGPVERTPALTAPPKRSELSPGLPAPKLRSPAKPPASKPIAVPPAMPGAPADKTTALPDGLAVPQARVYLVAAPAEAPKPAVIAPKRVIVVPKPKVAAPEGAAAKPKPEKPGEAAKTKPQGPPLPIVVTFGPSGIMIASEDLEALDAFEHLLNSLAPVVGASDTTIFYLKYTKAEVAADLLEKVFGVSSDSGGGGGGGLLGNMASGLMGDAGGGILGSLLGIGGSGGGSVAPTGSIQITPDARLNALIVQANAADTQKVEDLLKILDKKPPEEVAVEPKARVIPVINAQADEIAEIVKQVYQDRLISGAGAAGQQPSPQQFIQMLRGGGGRRGGRGGGGGSQRGNSDIEEKMAVGVDSRNNALIVVAPDQLFEQVKRLVEQVDQAAAQTNQTMRVVTLQRANPDAVQQALSALAGAGVQFGRTSTGTRAATPSGATATRGTTSPRATSSMPQGLPPAIQQQIQSRMQRGSQRPSGRSSRSRRAG